MKLKKYKNKIFIIIFVIFTILSIFWSVSEEKYEEPKETKVLETVKTNSKEKEKEEVKETKVKVDIKGEIVNPGVYELTTENNVNDAINMAGGLTEKSDTSNINLSKKLIDEMVIIVYSKEEIIKMTETKEVTCPKVNDACVKESDEKSKLTQNKTEKETNTNEKININEATKEELQTLSGIGEAKANAIIEYRNDKGKFEKIEDIKNVSGIGDAAFEKIKDQITI